MFGIEAEGEDEDEDDLWTEDEHDSPPSLPCLGSRLVFSVNGQPEYVPVVVSHSHVSAPSPPLEWKKEYELDQPAKRKPYMRLHQTRKGSNRCQ